MRPTDPADYDRTCGNGCECNDCAIYRSLQTPLVSVPETPLLSMADRDYVREHERRVQDAMASWWYGNRGSKS